MRMGGQLYIPVALPAVKRPGLVETQGRSERVRKISLPPGLRPRTVQLVTSHHTDYMYVISAQIRVNKTRGYRKVYNFKCR